MRRAAGLLLILSRLAILAAALLHQFAGNCDRTAREANRAMAAMSLCAQTLGCQIRVEDFRGLVNAKAAAMQCEDERK